ncbi:MAG: 3-hydroxyacyl-ACP dehydratase FabZ family protein [Planctomycetota bacterium]
MSPPEPPGQPDIDPAVLPHGAGFRFVTRVDERHVDPDGATRGRGAWVLTGEEAFFRDHFPTRPVLPGVLLIEALAQFSGLVHFADQDTPGQVGLAAVDVRLVRPVLPPTEVRLVTASRESAGPLTRFEVSALVDGAKVARGSLHLTGALQEEASRA